MKTNSFRLFGKNIFSTFDHYIMSLSYSNTINNINTLSMECITNKPKDMIDGTYSISTAKSLIKKNNGKCDMFLFRDTNSNVVGTLSVMYKGGNDIEYKIRNIEAFIYNVYTIEKYRGNGYAGEMIRLVMLFLHEISIERAHLAVSTNNMSAIKAYKKTGFTIDNKSSFIRVLKVNIPYKVL